MSSNKRRTPNKRRNPELMLTAFIVDPAFKRDRRLIGARR